MRLALLATVAAGWLAAWSLLTKARMPFACVCPVVLQGAVAFDVGTAWRQLHPTAGGGTPREYEYNFPVDL
jgi:hypothetical protein